MQPHFLLIPASRGEARQNHLETHTTFAGRSVHHKFLGTFLRQPTACEQSAALQAVQAGAGAFPHMLV